MMFSKLKRGEQEQFVQQQHEDLTRKHMIVSNNKLKNLVISKSETDKAGASIYNEFQKRCQQISKTLRTGKYGIMELHEDNNLKYAKSNLGPYNLEERGQTSHYCFNQQIRQNLQKNVQMGCEIKLSQISGKVAVYISDSVQKPSLQNHKMAIDGSQSEKMDIKVTFVPDPLTHRKNASDNWDVT